MDSLTKIDEKKPHVVFIPFPAQSHIKCMLKLARILHHKGLQITFINTQSNHTRLVKSGGTIWVNDAPGFQFKTVPDDSPDAGSNFYASFVDLVFKLETPLTCIICDGFMTSTNMISAAEKLKIPIILFWTMAACGFMGTYQVKDLVERGLVPLRDESYLTNGYLEMDTDWIPGMKRIRLKDLPEFITATTLDDPAFKYFLETSEAANKVSHIIIHTFEELEASLVKHIKSIFPNVYALGPLELLLNRISEKETKNSYSLWKEEPECVQWLQSKEPNTVIYVNFGSLAEMSLQHLLEFGWGLVNSNHAFLWIMRTNLVDGKPASFPQELKEAINRKGFVASWCSQEEVLEHPSVGGFLTHGGWGSIIESLSAGVPMICCPFFGDQRTNCRQMCKEWEVGMEIGRDVKRAEVEKLVRMLMEGAEGERMRKKAIEWKQKAEIATGQKGSSSLDTEKLAKLIINF